jgi:branched-chain amino acid transport system substrate-binding protein
MFRNLVAAILASVVCCSNAQAQFSDDKIVIGVMGDQGGVVADVGGPGSIVAARMAIEHVGGGVGRVPIEVVTADHQNKPDLAVSIAGEWFDRRGVDVIVDLPHTGAVLGLITVATDRKRALMVSGAASAEITGARCSPYVTHWTDDTYALARGTASALIDRGLRSWYFLTADYAFGHGLERDASLVVEDHGGKVLGSARHPLNTADFSSLLLRAQSSRARQRRRRHGQCHQAGRRIRACSGRPAARGAACVHHRCSQPGIGGGARADHHDGFLLERQ